MTERKPENPRRWLYDPDNPDYGMESIDEALDGAPHGEILKLETLYEGPPIWTVACWNEETGSDHREFTSYADAVAHSRGILAEQVKE